MELRENGARVDCQKTFSSPKLMALFQMPDMTCSLRPDLLNRSVSYLIQSDS